MVHSVSPRRRSSCWLWKPVDTTTLGGSDWSQSRIRRQIHKWVGVYDELRPRGTTSGVCRRSETGAERIHAQHASPPRLHNHPFDSIESTEFVFWYGCFRVMNDPTAGSPTVTLLRLHLPLNDEVWADSHGRAPVKVLSHDPETSPNHSIGRCDGRCVQRAGT